MKKMHSVWVKYLFLLILSMLAIPAYAQQSQSVAVLLKINGAISPAIQDYVQRGIARAANQNASIVILQMDTPGGLDKSMRGIIKSILTSSVPVVTYVAPSGARAASAGTYILYASHVAAMAPGTNLGAATPVQIGGGGLPGMPSPDQDKQKKNKKAPPKNAMKAKITNDAIAYIKSLAQLRGRNVKWAEKAVREAASLPAKEALKLNVIDVVAKDVPQLLQKLNGRKITIQGQQRVLKTANLSIEQINPDWRSRLLAVITDPSIAYILLLIGMYGLFFEFANPGFILPGVIGAIALLLALYALQLLPINYAGLALILLGVAFLTAEAFMPSFGALGIGGIIAFVAGSILLLDPNVAGYAIAWPLIAGMAVLNAAFFMGILGLVVKAKRNPVVSGADELLNLQGIVVDDFDNQGWVRIHSENWRALTALPLHQGQKVRVTKVDGLTLTVEPANGKLS